MSSHEVKLARQYLDDEHPLIATNFQESKNAKAIVEMGGFICSGITEKGCYYKPCHGGKESKKGRLHIDHVPSSHSIPEQKQRESATSSLGEEEYILNNKRIKNPRHLIKREGIKNERKGGKIVKIEVSKPHVKPIGNDICKENKEMTSTNLQVQESAQFTISPPTLLDVGASFAPTSTKLETIVMESRVQEEALSSRYVTCRRNSQGNCWENDQVEAMVP
ncbi:hypothetical protein ACFE04_016670 [Oxalis oulophora]